MLVMLINFTACASPKVKFNITVIDAETEKAIENVTAEFLFRDYHAKAVGMGWGTRVVSRTKEEKTNKMGFASAIGEANTANLPIIVNKEGYYEGYPGSAKPKLSHNRALNRWEPWPCEVTVKLKKIKDPVIKHYSFGKSYMKLPIKVKDVGFDMLKGDWVKPHGEGDNADFKVSLINQEIVDETHTRDIASFVFQSNYDGIQDYSADKNNQSSFYWPYLAPENGYKSYQLFRNYEIVPGTLYPQSRENNIRERTSFVRIRTKVDKRGSIVSAYYGVITNLSFDSVLNTISISYQLNADNQSRSLELLYCFSGS